MKIQYQTGSFPLKGATSGRIHGAVLTIETGLKFTGKRHMALVVDCSGSMAADIGQVREDAVRFVGDLDPKYFVSVVVFSGHQTSKLIAGPVQCNKDGKDLLIRAIQRDVRIMDTTVFSEPLDLTLQTLTRLSGKDTAHSVTLFTDGVAVPQKWTAEVERTKALTVARKIAGSYASVVNAIGYGYYYDDKFLRDLAANGVYRHVSDIDNFGSVVQQLREQFDEHVPADLDLELTPNPMGGQSIINLWRVTPDLVHLPAGNSAHIKLLGLPEGTLRLYLQLSRGDGDGVVLKGTLNGDSLKQSVPDTKMDKDAMSEFIRVMGAAMLLKGDDRLAAELLSQGGDANLADRAINSHSTRERREVSDEARRYFQDRRFIGAGLKPAGQNHCVLNALRVLIEDENNVIYLPPGSYQRGGVLTTDPNVVASPLGSTVKVTGYVSAAERFNFSVRGLKDIKVRDGGAVVNKQMWRTYNIIRDGNLVTPRLKATLSTDSFDILNEAGVIEGKPVRYDAALTYAIDLTSLRLISSAWANPRNLGLVPLLREEADLESLQTALNARIKALGRPGSNDGAEIYHPRNDKASGPTETYQANCAEIRLMGYTAQTVPAGVHTLPYDQAITRVKEVRQRLVVVRWLIRSVCFAMEVTGSKVIPWGPAKATSRGKNPKDEHAATFEGAQLKLVRWQEEIEFS